MADKKLVKFNATIFYNPETEEFHLGCLYKLVPAIGIQTWKEGSTRDRNYFAAQGFETRKYKKERL